MNEPMDAAAPPRVFLLPEAGHAQLVQLRDELLLLAGMAVSTDTSEAKAPLNIPRSMLGRLLESYGLRVEDVLNTLGWPD
jgi:hypothetical protein